MVQAVNLEREEDYNVKRSTVLIQSIRTDQIQGQVQQKDASDKGLFCLPFIQQSVQTSLGSQIELL